MAEIVRSGEICRIDVQNRSVWGMLATEQLGADGFVLDYDATVAAVQRWAGPTGDVGNMREMHQPIAVGVSRSYHTDDENRCVFLGSKVSRGAESTWLKIEDGVLRYYSIRGPIRRMEQRPIKVDGVMRMVNWVTDYDISETSYVDRPGDLGIAPFEVGITRSAQPTDILEAGDLPVPSNLEMEIVRAPQHSPMNGSHRHAHTAAGDQGSDATHEHLHSHLNDNNHAHDHTAVHRAGALVGAAISRATKSEADGDHPAGDYAYVPDAEKPSTWKLRIDDAQHVGAAAAALGPGYRGQKVDIPDADRAKVIAKVRAAWKKLNPDKAEGDMPDVLKRSLPISVMAQWREMTKEAASQLTELFRLGAMDKLVEAAQSGVGVWQLRRQFDEGGDLSATEQVIMQLWGLMAQEAAERPPEADTWGISLLICAINDLQCFMMSEAMERAIARQEADTIMATTDELLQELRASREVNAAILQRMSGAPSASQNPEVQVNQPSSTPVQPSTGTTDTPQQTPVPGAVPQQGQPAAPETVQPNAPAPNQTTNAPQDVLRMAGQPQQPPENTILVEVARSLKESADVNRMVLERLAATPAQRGPFLNGVAAYSPDKLFSGEAPQQLTQEQSAGIEVRRQLGDLALNSEDPSIRDRARLLSVETALKDVREETHTALAGGVQQAR